MEKYSKYLPSKKFIIITSIIIILAIAIFMIFFMSSSGENFFTKETENSIALKTENQTINQLIKNDTDGDGIADWEEALWGTDKNKKVTFNNMSDSTYIENKKKELKIEQNATVDATKLTETEKFAREFFSSYSAMKSSGQIDDNTINNFSSSLGQKIVNPNLIDRYKETDIKISMSDDSTSKFKYYNDIKTLFKKYQEEAGLGNELSIISNGLASQSANGGINNPNQYDELISIANGYQDFSKKIMEINVPQSLTSYHLQIANNSNNTGISVLNMAKIITDPIVGLSGLAQYQKYSEDLIKAVEDLEATLLQQ